MAASTTPNIAPVSVSPTPQWRAWTGRLVFEGTLIVFSVLLALTLDGWRQDAAEERRLNEALESLADELKFNRELLEQPRHLEYHRGLYRHYLALADSDSIDGADKAFKDGLRIARVRDTAWTSFMASDVSNRLPFALRAELAGIYGDQDGIDELFRLTIGGLVAARSDRDVPAYRRDQIRVLAMFLTDLVIREERLLNEYAAVELRLRERLR